jgi:hypothetical protein
MSLGRFLSRLMRESINRHSTPSTELIKVRDVVQYHIPRRWLFPDADHWLNENPWWPDFQIRLLRNDPATLRYGGTHEPVAATMPWRCLEPPMYHLSCLVASIAARRTKAQLYDRDITGMISPAGGPFNEVLQIPEQYATRRPLPVPEADRAWIHEALDAKLMAVGGVAPSFPVVPPEQIDAHSPMLLNVEADAYRARLQVIDRDTRFALNVPRTLVVRVENCGPETWRWGWQRRGIRLSYHWWTLDGQPLTFDGVRTPLPADIRPGESVLVATNVIPPAATGRYLLDIDLVHEEVRWFNCPVRLDVQVVERWQRF